MYVPPIFSMHRVQGKYMQQRQQLRVRLSWPQRTLRAIWPNASTCLDPLEEATPDSVSTTAHAGPCYPPNKAAWSTLDRSRALASTDLKSVTRGASIPWSNSNSTSLAKLVHSVYFPPNGWGLIQPPFLPSENFPSQPVG